MAVITKTKTGQFVIVAAPNAHKIGAKLTVGYDLAQFAANGNKAEVVVTGCGKVFEKAVQSGYYDDNRAGEQGYDNEGFRVTDQQIQKFCYFYVRVVREIKAAVVAPKFYITLGGRTIEVDERVKRAFNNNYNHDWFRVKQQFLAELA